MASSESITSRSAKQVSFISIYIYTYTFIILFDLMLYVQVNNLLVSLGRISLG